MNQHNTGQSNFVIIITSTLRIQPYKAFWSVVVALLVVVVEVIVGDQKEKLKKERERYVCIYIYIYVYVYRQIDRDMYI